MSRQPQPQFKTMSRALRTVFAIAALAASATSGALLDTLAQRQDATARASAQSAPLVVARAQARACSL